MKREEDEEKEKEEEEDGKGQLYSVLERFSSNYKLENEESTRTIGTKYRFKISLGYN